MSIGSSDEHAPPPPPPAAAIRPAHADPSPPPPPPTSQQPSSSATPSAAAASATEAPPPRDDDEEEEEEESSVPLTNGTQGRRRVEAVLSTHAKASLTAALSRDPQLLLPTPPSRSPRHITGGGEMQAVFRDPTARVESRPAGHEQQQHGRPSATPTPPLPRDDDPPASLPPSSSSSSPPSAARPPSTWSSLVASSVASVNNAGTGLASTLFRAGGGGGGGGGGSGGGWTLGMGVNGGASASAGANGARADEGVAAVPPPPAGVGTPNAPRVAPAEAVVVAATASKAPDVGVDAEDQARAGERTPTTSPPLARRATTADTTTTRTRTTTLGRVEGGSSTRPTSPSSSALPSPSPSPSPPPPAPTLPRPTTSASASLVLARERAERRERRQLGVGIETATDAGAPARFHGGESSRGGRGGPSTSSSLSGGEGGGAQGEAAVRAADGGEGGVEGGERGSGGRDGGGGGSWMGVSSTSSSVLGTLRGWLGGSGGGGGGGGALAPGGKTTGLGLGVSSKGRASDPPAAAAAAAAAESSTLASAGGKGRRPNSMLVELPRGSFPSSASSSKPAGKTSGRGGPKSEPADRRDLPSGSRGHVDGGASRSPAAAPTTAKPPPLASGVSPHSAKPRSVLDDRPGEREEEARRQRERAARQAARERERNDVEIEEHDLSGVELGVPVTADSSEPSGSSNPTGSSGDARPPPPPPPPAAAHHFPPRRYYVLSAAGKPVFVSELATSRLARAAEAAAERLAVKRAKALHQSTQTASGRGAADDADEEGGAGRSQRAAEAEEDEEMDAVLEASRKARRERDDNEDEEATLRCAAMQALISNYARDDDPRRLSSMSSRVLGLARGEEITYLLRPPLYLACVSAWCEPPSVRRAHLEALHLAVLSLVPAPQLKRLFARAANFDLRRMLDGTDGLLAAFVERLQHEPGLLLSALQPLRMEPALRDDVAAALSPNARPPRPVDPSSSSSVAPARPKELLYVLLLASERVVTLLRPRRHAVHPVDAHVVLNTVYAAKAVRERGTESWMPICLPKFAPQGFVHAHVSFLDARGARRMPDEVRKKLPSSRANRRDAAAANSAAEASREDSDDDAKAEGGEMGSLPNQTTPIYDPALVFITGDKDGFAELSAWKNHIHDSLAATSQLARLRRAARSAAYSADELGIPGLRHFVFKWRSNVQLTSPVFEPPYEVGSSAYGRLTCLYGMAWDLLAPCRKGGRTALATASFQSREAKPRAASKPTESSQGEAPAGSADAASDAKPDARRPDVDEDGTQGRTQDQRMTKEEAKGEGEGSGVGDSEADAPVRADGALTPTPDARRSSSRDGDGGGADSQARGAGASRDLDDASSDDPDGFGEDQRVDGEDTDGDRTIDEEGGHDAEAPPYTLARLAQLLDSRPASERGGARDGDPAKATTTPGNEPNSTSSSTTAAHMPSSASSLSSSSLATVLRHRHVLRTRHEAVLGWHTSHFELYLCASAHLSPRALHAAALAVVRWVKSEEHRLFVVSAPAF